MANSSFCGDTLATNSLQVTDNPNSSLDVSTHLLHLPIVLVIILLKKKKKNTT